MELVLDERIVACAVADGLGGHRGGSVASRTVGQMLADEVSAASEAEVEAVLRLADQRLLELSRTQPRLKGLGATVGGLLLSGFECIAFNVGDVRVFTTDGEYLVARSIDDRAYDEVTDSQVVTQCVGGDTGSSVSRFNPHVSRHTLRNGDRFLICSDGLTDTVALEEIESRMQEELAVAVEGLMKDAWSAGAPDNISIVVGEFAGDDVEQETNAPIAELGHPERDRGCPESG